MSIVVPPCRADVHPPSPASFIKTNQSNVLDAPNLPDVVDGMRKVSFAGLLSTPPTFFGRAIPPLPSTPFRVTYRMYPPSSFCRQSLSLPNQISSPLSHSISRHPTQVCALSSALLGNVSVTNNESAATSAPSPTSNAASATPVGLSPLLPVVAAVALGAVGGVLAL